MATTAIVTDSTADFVGISPDGLDVTVVPLTVNWGQDVLRDKIDVSTEDFYARLRTDRVLPKTAAPPVGIFEDLYRRLLADHDAVISIHIAAKLSATHSVAAAAAQSIAPDRIRVLDSTNLSVELGWMACRAAELAEAGEGPDAIVAALDQMIPHLRLYLTLETLEYLQRGGRIGRAQAFLGGLLNVKPVLQVRDSEVHPVERVRTRQASIRRVAELTRGLGLKERIAVVHGDCEREAEELRDRVSEMEGISDVPMAEIGSVLGTHAGPGVIGIGCVLAP